MRGLVLALVAVLMLSGIGFAVAEDTKAPSLENLAKFEGRSPEDLAYNPKNNKKPHREYGSIWADAALRLAAARGLGKGFIERLEKTEGLRVWDMIKKNGQTLMLSYCVQEACGFDNIRIFINMQKGTVSACLHGLGPLIGLRPTIDMGIHEDYWIAKGQLKKLDLNSCAKLGYYAPKAND